MCITHGTPSVSIMKGDLLKATCLGFNVSLSCLNLLVYTFFTHSTGDSHLRHYSIVRSKKLEVLRITRPNDEPNSTKVVSLSFVNRGRSSPVHLNPPT